MSDSLRLWVDGQCFQTKSRSGSIGRYVATLLRSFKADNNHFDLHISLNAGMPGEAIAARDFLSDFIRPENIHVWHGVAANGECVEGLTDRRRLSEAALAYHVACIAPDVALSASPFEGAYDSAVPLLPHVGNEIPFFSIFHDSSPVNAVDPGQNYALVDSFQRRRLMAYERFSGNLCVSELARQELMGLVGTKECVTIGASVYSDFTSHLARHETTPPSGDTSVHAAQSGWQMRANKALVRVQGLKLPHDLTVGCLARSEIRHSEANRLIIEATATVISDGGSGIQRVVKKISSSMRSSVDTTVVVGFSDNSTDWFEVQEGCLDQGAHETKRTGTRIFFTERDHVLMLDSSWAFRDIHAHSLRNARLRGAKVTTCLYDTVPLRASGFSSSHMPPVFSQWLQSALTYSTGFVCISKAVADEFLELLKHLRFPRPLDVGYWPLGADFGSAQPRGESPAGSKGSNNFLMVGTIEPRKGYRVALDAFDLLWKQNIDASLTIIGKQGWNVGSLIDRLKNHPEFGRRLFWNNSATDSQLVDAYASADCLIASSFAEGFGLPIVEAGYFGKPIIASDIPVFREVSAKAQGSRFFDVGDAHALANEVNGFLVDRGKGSTVDRVALGGAQWENWLESSARLKDVLVNDKWYVRYTPEHPNDFSDTAVIGSFTMTAVLDPEECEYSIRMVDGPMSADSSSARKFIVAISNHSSALWSSRGQSDGSFGVFLGSRLFAANGELLREGDRTEIPLIIAPGDTVYLPIEVESDWSNIKDAEVHVEMYQQGNRWWGKPLMIPVDEIKASEICA